MTMSLSSHSGLKSPKQSAQLGNPRVSAGFAHPQTPSQMFTPRERLCLHAGRAGASWCLNNSFLRVTVSDPHVPHHHHVCSHLFVQGHMNPHQRIPPMLPMEAPDIVAYTPHSLQRLPTVAATLSFTKPDLSQHKALHQPSAW